MSWGNQLQEQDLARFPFPKSIISVNWSEGDTLFIEYKSGIFPLSDERESGLAKTIKLTVSG